ncbi:MAG: phospholipase [Rhodospirillaceae bacterium]|jgi:phospholipase/carboxylesterase|nr:phospholipase [Rhodospirillaceae bacterium]MBT4219165.1 phospholipase [Rhodospirillaceae bacterium]MBT4464047.1 phospholipase [Rhodospirillaceae bacterium]MBT5014019.1 phospholipase [Rhodospirillaceae bacterium]MBT5309817.1 phospholipase [Rhodospirillaceae bacterium]
MSDLPVLTGPRLEPASGTDPKQLVILLHGVGADGNDLIGLAPYFQKTLPDALFISPNAPFAFDMAPVGHQWFSLQDFSETARRDGVLGAAPILDRFIDDMLAETGLSEDKLVLIGFSQGTMMSLHVGLRRKTPLAGIIGYSGMLTDAETLKQEIASRPPVLLTHGDADPVLPVAALPDAVAGLEAAGVTVEHHIRPGLPHGIDEECIRLGQEFLKRVLG